jgi:hypothetical protein
LGLRASVAGAWRDGGIDQVAGSLVVQFHRHVVAPGDDLDPVSVRMLEVKCVDLVNSWLHHSLLSLTAARAVEQSIFGAAIR